MSDKTENENLRPASIFDDVIAQALAEQSLSGNGRTLDDKALLAKYGLDDLDVTFSMRDLATNEILREKEPCYECLAEGLRMRREGKTAMDLRAGDISRNFAPQSGGRSPPMLGAKMSDMSQIGPGMTRNLAAVTGPGAGVRRAAAAPLGGPPPGR